MDPARWRQVKDILQEASTLPASDRTSFLDRACKGDSALRTEVEELLEASDQAGEFLNAPALAQTAAAGHLATAMEGSLAGSQVGHYRVIEEIGRGGMAVVYKAVREDDFRQEVALKVMKRGMDTDELLERFRHERQILAQLNHHNIARLMDGGTTADSRPYFVMEFVEGQPVTEYCEQRQLSLEQRLRLFLKICSAVEYAHQNLVIHRDLKPANILVDAGGEPKLLDFGIAKVFSSDAPEKTAGLTAAQARLLTPEYASPEQVRGERITIATDIYALGAVLYELLTGSKAHQIESTAALELERAICLSEPVKPSERAASGRKELARQLRGDLDNIALKALEKQPERRYRHASQFAEDIERYLDGRPVLARPDTLRYRAVKFCRRNRALVVGAAAVALTLIGGIVTTTWQAQVARRERAVAQRRFDEVRKLAYSLLFEIDPEIEPLAGALKAREKLLSRTVDYLDALSRDAGGDPELLRELAQAYERVAEVQGREGVSNLGRTELAGQNVRKALALREQLLATNPASTDFSLDLGQTIRSLLNLTRDPAEKRALALRSLNIAESAEKRNPENVRARTAIAGAYYEMGELTRPSDAGAAIEYYRKALARYRDPSSIALLHKKIGAVSANSGNLPLALDEYKAAIAIDEEIVRREPNNARARMDLSYGYSDLGFVLGKLKRHPEAIASYRKAEAIRFAQAAADPSDARARAAVVSITWRMADALAAGCERQAALESVAKSIQLGDAIVRDFPEQGVTVKDEALAPYAAYTKLFEEWAACEDASRRRELWRAKAAEWKVQVSPDISNHGLCK